MKLINLSLNKVQFYLVNILFFVIIVLGESFKLAISNASLSLSLFVLIIYFIIVIFQYNTIRINFISIVLFIFFILSVFFSFIGFFANNNLGDIIEDVYPIFIIFIIYLSLIKFNLASLVMLWKNIVLFSVIAAFKVIFINFSNLDFAWSNNWQAAKEALPISNFFRILLRGGDIYMSFGLVYFLLCVNLRKGDINVKLFIFMLASILAIFLSLSRSSFFAIFVVLPIVFLIFNYFFLVKRIFFLLIVTFFTVIIISPFFNAISLISSVMEVRNETFDSNDFSTEFRQNEKNLLYAKAANNNYLGNGMGSYFFIPYSGSEKSDGRSIYSHDFNAWIIFKMGIFGLVLFYILFCKSMYNIYISLIRNKNSLTHASILVGLSVFSSGIVFLIISFLANKFSTIGGAAFFGFFLAFSIVIKSHIADYRL